MLNKKAGFTDLFLFIILAFVIVVILGALIYVFNETEDQLQDTLGSMTI